MEFHSLEWISRSFEGGPRSGPDELPLVRVEVQVAHRSEVMWHPAPMADKPEDGPSLEMPSFSLRRKKKEKTEEDVAPEAATPEPVAEPEPAPVPEPRSRPVPEPQAVPEPATVEQPVVEHTTALPGTEPGLEPAPETEPEAAEPKRRRELPRPSISGLPAAALTGAVVGGLAVLLAWLAGVGCSAVRGTSSCGGAAGLPLLLVGLGVLAYAGTVLLRLFGVREAGSTSLLAVGILSVLVLVFLLGSTDEWWMVIAIPVTAVIAYCASWWVTTAVVGDEPEPAGARTPYDVR